MMIGLVTKLSVVRPMPESLNLRRRRLGISFLFISSSILLLQPLKTSCQTSENRNGNSTESESVFRLKTSGNLVVLRVIVRGGDGKPVEGLRKEDFRILDRGKEQPISQFQASSSPAVTSSTVVIPDKRAISAPAAASPTAAKQSAYVALYFDDLNTSDVNMIYTRQGADRYLSTSLGPENRVAIFTSDQMLSDFTSNPQQIHAALSKLQASAHSLTRVHNCPDLSDYQAQEITQQNPDFSEAWQMALDEAVKRCKLLAVNQESDAGLQGDNPKATQEAAQNPLSPNAETQLASMIRMMARGIVFQFETQARINFAQLDRLVDYMSKMPGQRTIVLVSPGFLSQNEQYELDRVIDHAVRSQVVISSLDPRGLAPPKESDATRSYIAGHSGSAERLDSQREIAASDVLAQVAQDTGGEYYRNNNDLNAGFSALAGPSVYYLLAFAPTGLKPDGKFHALKVELADKHIGFSVQARRGYFAPKNGADAEAENRRQEAADSEIQTQNRIQEAIVSKAEVRQFPVALTGKLSDGQNGTRDLSLITHLDATSLHLRKDRKENLNTLTFAFAVFDEQEKMIAAEQKASSVSLSDAQVPAFLKSGVTISVDFRLKPGTYRIREVIIDSEEQHLTAVSTKIAIP